jgi:hypothetical protein
MLRHRNLVNLATVSTTAAVTAFTLSRYNSDNASSSNKSGRNSSHDNRAQIQIKIQQSSLFAGKSSNLDKMKDNITKSDNSINQNNYPLSLCSHLLYDQNSITHCSKEQAPLSSAAHTMTTASTLMKPGSSYKPLTKTQSILYKLRLLNDKSLTTPRLLSPNDPIFEYRALKNGLKLRTKDELKLRELQIEISALVQKQQQEQKQQNMIDGTNSTTNNTDNEEKRKIMKDMMERISEVVNGKGITPQMREDFLIKYGCTAYTTPILDTIIQYSAEHGIIEIGAGNGQWAKALSTHHAKLLQSSTSSSSSNSIHIPPSPLQQFIVAYDDMSQTPLNTQIYHKYTQPSQNYFFQSIQNMKGQDAVGLLKNRGRVLLLVFPPPNDMALEVVKQYTKFDGNDTIIYVGEGVGGANANQAFFDYFLNQNQDDSKSVNDNDGDDGSSSNKFKWVVLETKEVEDVFGGGKGFEMMFVLKRVKV